MRCFNAVLTGATTLSLTTLGMEWIIWDIQHNDTQCKGTHFTKTANVQNVIMLSDAFYLLLCWMSLCWVSRFIIVLLNVIMLSVIMPIVVVLSGVAPFGTLTENIQELKKNLKPDWWFLSTLSSIVWRSFCHYLQPTTTPSGNVIKNFFVHDAARPSVIKN
jgi:hypothetical protein